MPLKPKTKKSPSTSTATDKKNSNSKKDKKKDASKALTTSLAQQAQQPSLTSYYRVGDIVWFYGTPRSRDEKTLLRCDVNSRTKFYARVSYIVPNQFYCLQYLDSGRPIKRPFQDQNLNQVHDYELAGLDVSYLKFYDSFNKAIDKIVWN